jgi:hypothetical protein
MADIRRDPPPVDGEQEAASTVPAPAEYPPIPVGLPAGIRLLNSLARLPGRWLDHSGAWESLDNRINWDSFPPPPPPRTAA